VNRPTLIGQLFRVHTLVVAVACALLVLATMAASATLLRNRQDRTLEAIAVEVANGVEVEAAEEHVTTVRGAEEYFRESRLEGYRFELLDKDGVLAASDGKLSGWTSDGFDVAVDARAGSPRPRAGALRGDLFRACARWCGPDYVVRVVTSDVLDHTDVRWVGGVLLGALPLATLIGALLGRALFNRRLRPLGRLEAAAAASAADPDVTLRVEAPAREIATLRDAFNGLLARLGEALARERRFTQEASHELRTPLAAIRGRIERLATDGPLTVNQAGHVATALREVDGLTALADALLLLARSESAPLPATPVNLCDLARAVASDHAAQVEAPDEVLVRGSEELLNRAIANLVENARKFGGPKARIQVRVTADGKSAAIAVADDGPGIDAADREHVFDRFYRAPGARAATDGVGLGLPVARAIALRHHGTIDVTSSDSGGAEFRIVLPLLVLDGDGSRA
jgi:signal transduction histidine kinase